MGRSRRIYLDMDGVLAGMREALVVRLGLPADFVWPPGVWDVCEALNRPAEEIWPAVADHAFWADEIQPLPGAAELVSAAVSLVGWADVRVCSRPTLSPLSASGKIAWLGRHFPALSRQYTFAVDKTDVGRPGDVLVDDSERNVRTWVAAGGHAVLWPAPQNRRHADTWAAGLADLRRLFAPAPQLSAGGGFVGYSSFWADAPE